MYYLLLILLIALIFINNSYSKEILKFKRGDEDMVMAYVTLISRGAKTIDSVPKQLKQQVLDLLEVMELDGYGNPIE